MILVAGGDSFIHGAELSDQIMPNPSNLTYPSLLAQQYGMEYSCAAWPGSANNCITRLTLAECERLRKLGEKFAVIISWTFTFRYEFRFSYDTYNKTTPWYSINIWDVDTNRIYDKLTKNTDIVDFIKMYYKHVGDNEYNEIYTTLKEVMFMQNYLKTNGIPYVFTTADNTFYQCNNTRDTYVDNLYDQIDWDKWYFFPAGTETNETQNPRGFYQWAVENKYDIGVNRHPLDLAHRDAAELIKGTFDELVIKNLQ